MYSITMHADLSQADWRDDFAELADRYENQGVIGKGAYGCVYKARKLTKQTEIYALKKIQPLKEKDGFPVTALREIKILQSLNHENIIKLHHIISSKASSMNSLRSSTFLVLEYMEHDFFSLIQNVTFTMNEMKCMIRQLLEGVAYLHSLKIIHRDLKTGNLLMNNKGQLKIADFGLAKYHYVHNTKLTKDVVTSWYRAPELFYGERLYSNAIDIWSVGCIIAELLTKKVLFEAKEPKEQLEKIYSKLGSPEEGWSECKSLPFYSELKPKCKFMKTIGSYIRERCPEADQSCIDLLESLLCFNPANRISARKALEHEFFHVAPYPCLPGQIQKLNKEYHDYVMRYGESIDKRKLNKERLEQERRPSDSLPKKWKDSFNGRGMAPSGREASKSKLNAALLMNNTRSEQEDDNNGRSLGKRKPDSMSSEKVIESIRD